MSADVDIFARIEAGFTEEHNDEVGDAYAALEELKASAQLIGEALTRLRDACDDSDGSCYGSLSTSFVRALIDGPLALLTRAQS